MMGILVIDDDEQVRRLLKEILLQEGFSVMEANNGQDGLEICRERPVDLVVLDIFMPNKEGLESITELRQKFSGIKILAMSGGMPGLNMDVLATAKRLGAHQTITKPFPIHTFIKRVHELLGRDEFPDPRGSDGEELFIE